MDEVGYREFLDARELTDDEIEKSVSVVRQFETYLRESRGGVSAADAAVGDVDAFSTELIAAERNTWDAYVALARYGLFVDNRTLYVASVAYLDGHEAFGNLHAMLADRIGAEVRDELFSGSEVPPLGTPGITKAQLMGTVVGRLSEMDAATCTEVLGTGLRDLEDEWYKSEREKYEECGNVDAYLARKADDFIAELEEHQAEGKWWWGQVITDEVIDYVRTNRAISSGVREGRTIIKAKIPYMAHEYLTEQDPARKRYYYCHCPWARESLASPDVEVAPVFCNCSAAFSKKPWEIIFGQTLDAEVLESVLAGDEWCRFAIHLPDDAVLSGDGPPG
jgi:hypothetical protein